MGAGSLLVPIVAFLVPEDLDRGGMARRLGLDDRSARATRARRHRGRGQRIALLWRHEPAGRHGMGT